MRAFVALDLADELKEALARLIGRLERNAPQNARFTDAKKMHLTLKFLGDIDEEQSKTIGAAVSDAGQRAAPRIALAKLDAFPSLSRARVAIVSIEGPEILPLATAMDDVAFAIGIEREERAYHAHITLARLKEPSDVRAWLASESIAGDALATAITLYRSDLSPKGATYTPIVTSKFR